MTDYSKVRLISITKSLIEEADTAEELLAYIARVSNPKNQGNKETAINLLKYMWKNGHYSPFEMVDMTMEIITTRDISRQILRHWSYRFQEFSQRYAQVSGDSFVIREARLQDTKNRQNSLECNDETLSKMWEIRQEEHIERSKELYQWAIDNGIAKEQARIVLPEGQTLSRLYMKGNLRSWIFYTDLRTLNSTQKEHRIIAGKCKDILKEQFPVLKELII